MNRINPLYIAVALFVLFVAVVYQTISLKKSFALEQQRIQSIEQLGVKIHQLRLYWKDKKAQRQRIESIVRMFSKFVREKKRKKNRYIVTFDNVDRGSADRIVQKIFNSFVKVHSFSIEKKSDKAISIKVEFLL